jgi:hypothetical protein
VAVDLTPVQTKQIRINIRKRNRAKNSVQTIQNAVNTNTHLKSAQHELRKDGRILWSKHVEVIFVHELVKLFGNHYTCIYCLVLVQPLT